MEELKDRARAQRDGLATAFDPLREKIEKLKNSFWEIHGDNIKAAAKKYVEKKVKERVAVEASHTSSRPPFSVISTGSIHRSKRRSNITAAV